MHKLTTIFGGVGLVLGGALTTAFAHHPITGKFDPDVALTLQGIVTYVDWRDPHAHVFVNVDDGGDVLNWAVEVESPNILRANGWGEKTLQPGDSITVEGMRARDGSRQVWGDHILRAGSRQPVFTVSYTPPPVPLAPRPTPRWPDGRPALGAVPGGVGGYWSHPSATALVEDGVEVRMNRDGLLADVDDASRVAPLKPWALGLFEHRQERALRDDPMYLNCKPPGGPRQFQSNLGVQLIEDHAQQRVFVLMGSGNRNYRIVYLDGREHVGQVGGDDDNPLYYGRSVGSWDGDTLVVDTRGFNEDFWFSNGGLPHTNRLRLVERFTRSDLDTLTYEVTVEDMGAYTRPWTASWTLQWVGGQELPSHFCQNNRP
jgi:hypothetical protein